MIFLPLLLLFHFFLLFFTRFTLWPEMVVYPYLLNHGFLLYRDIINPYPPLLAYKLSIFASLFGYQPFPYQVMTWLIILITDIAIFFAASKITKSRSKGLMATLFFIVLSIPFGVNGLWYDLVQTPFIIIAVYFFGKLLDKKTDNISLLVSSISLAIAFFIKQQVLWLILWFLAIVVYRQRNDKRNLARQVFIMIAPIVIGFGLEVLLILPQGIFNDFIKWTIYLPFFKASQMPGYVLLPTLRQAATIAIFFSVFIPVVLKRKLVQVFYFLTAVVLLFFAYPRFDLFHLIPSLSILALVFALSINNFRKQKLPTAAISILVLVFFSLATASYLKTNWTREVRFFGKDTRDIANAISKINPKNKPIFLQNVSGEILPLSGALPTKPWADSFPWYLEMPFMQANVAGGILNEKPDIVVYKPYAGGGQFQIASYRPKALADFLDQNYTEVSKIDGLQIKARLFK